MFVTFLICNFSSHSTTFHSFGDVIISVKRLQVLTNVRHLWSLSNKGSLIYNIYCDKVHPLKMVISEDASKMEQLIPVLKIKVCAAVIRILDLALALANALTDCEKNPFMNRYIDRLKDRRTGRWMYSWIVLIIYCSCHINVLLTYKQTLQI